MKQKVNYSVVAIVVTHNRKKLLKECITALYDQTYKNLDILVIDNASTDGTKDYIRDYLHFSNFFFCRTSQNIGGAGGFNKGMKLAAEKGYDYMWLMDDDTIPENDSLEQLINAVQILNNDFGFLVSYAQFVDETPCIMNIPEVKMTNWIYDKKLLRDGLIQVERATFVSFFVSNDIVLKKGLPIKEFFIWADDTEYSKRISQDIPSYFVGNSIVTHKVKSNVGPYDDDFISCDIERLKRYRYRYRNRFYVIKREGPRAIWNYFAEFLALNVKLLHAKDHRLRRWIVLWEGFISGIFFNPSIEYVETRD